MALAERARRESAAQVPGVCSECWTPSAAPMTRLPISSTTG